MANEKPLTKKEFKELWDEANELAAFIVSLDEDQKEKLTYILMGMKMVRKNEE